MNLKDYTPLAMRTESKNYMRLFRPLDVRLNHAALGIASETAKLLDWLAANHAAQQSEGAAVVDRANLLEELGDILWYAALGSDAIGIELADLVEVGRQQDFNLPWPGGSLLDTAQAAIRWLNRAAGELADFVKRTIFYGQQIDPAKAGSSLAYVLTAVRHLAEAAGSSIEEVAAINIAKLRRRYPNTFNSNDAVNRDLAAERSVLEEGERA